LLNAARARQVPGGATIHSEGDTVPHFELLVSGFVRVFVAAPDGRTLTVRYCRPGAILGAVSLFAEAFVLPATIRALLDSVILVFDPHRVKRLATTEPAVAEALLVELSQRVRAFIDQIPSSAFATARQRIARHLLDLASEQQSGARLVTRVTQAELAQASGTVREVAVRVLREFRAERLVETGRRGVVILDPSGLLSETYEWNQSR
jgi:CRP/FNR family transcriptional regulator